MFSQQHYEALAKVLKETRAEQTAQHSSGEISTEQYLQQQEAVGALQLRLHTLFKKDNPKFKELLFIGAASEHAPKTTR